MSAESSKNTIKTRLNGLKNSVDDALASISQAQKETHAELQSRINETAAAADATAAKLDQKTSDTVDAAQSKWRELLASTKQKKEDIAQKIKDRQETRDAKFAEWDAERAEQYAIDSIDFAYAAIQDAKLSVLDAIDARLYADEFDANSA